MQVALSMLKDTTQPCGNTTRSCLIQGLTHGHILSGDRFCLWFGVPHGHVPLRYGCVAMLSYLVHFLCVLKWFLIFSYIFLIF